MSRSLSWIHHSSNWTQEHSRERRSSWSRQLKMLLTDKQTLQCTESEVLLYTALLIVDQFQQWALLNDRESNASWMHSKQLKMCLAVCTLMLIATTHTQCPHLLHHQIYGETFELPIGVLAAATMTTLLLDMTEFFQRLLHTDLAWLIARGHLTSASFDSRMMVVWLF